MATFSVADLADASAYIDHALASAAEKTWRSVTATMEAVLRESNKNMIITSYSKGCIKRMPNAVLVAVKATGVRSWSQYLQGQLLEKLGPNIEWDSKVLDGQNTMTISVWKAIETPVLKTPYAAATAPASPQPYESGITLESLLNEYLPLHYFIMAFFLVMLVTVVSYILFDADQTQILSWISAVRSSSSSSGGGGGGDGSNGSSATKKYA